MNHDPAQLVVVAELLKLAATRYDKEIAKGNIHRSQVFPAAAHFTPDDASPEVLASNKRQTRRYVQQPAARPAAELEQTRKLNHALFENAKRRGPWYKDVPDRDLAQANMEIDAPYVSRNVARELRKMTGEVNPAPAPKDATIRQAVMQHELGELDVGHGRTGTEKHLDYRGKRRPEIRPNASHRGPNAILRENIPLSRDPDARKTMDKLRTINSDDALVQKLIRQAGGRADAPIPLGGRRERALNRMLDRNVDKLTARSRAVSLEDSKEHITPYVPEEVQTAHIISESRGTKSPVVDQFVARGTSKAPKPKLTGSKNWGLPQQDPRYNPADISPQEVLRRAGVPPVSKRSIGTGVLEALRKVAAAR